MNQTNYWKQEAADKSSYIAYHKGGGAAKPSNTINVHTTISQKVNRIHT